MDNKFSENKSPSQIYIHVMQYYISIDKERREEEYMLGN